MSDWQPIETAPRDGTDIVLVGRLPGQTRLRATVGHWTAGVYAIDEAGWVFTAPGYVDTFDATHWAPLPEPIDHQHHEAQNNG